MSDVKWVKITTDMFDNRKIKYIRTLPEGNNIVLIWVMLLTIAGRCNSGGMIFLAENIPYNYSMLANELGFEVNTVKLALDALEQLGMIVCKEECFMISNWMEYQNADGLEKIREQNRLRQQKYRKNKLELMESNVCQYCGGVATGYDHIIALSRGGADEEANKVPCCKRCNSAKNDKPLVDFLNNYRGIINDEIVTENEKLSRYVTLDNVTGRYTVTHSSISVSNSNSVSNKSNKLEAGSKDKKRFVPPTLEEVIEYCKQRNSSVDPKYFYDYFTTGHWIDSEGKPVHNWKQKLITWENHNQGGKQNDSRRNTGNGGESTNRVSKDWGIVYSN